MSLSLHGYGVLYLLMCVLHSIVRTVGFLSIIKRHVGYVNLSLKVKGMADLVQLNCFPEKLSGEGMHFRRHGELPYHGKRGKFSRQQHKTTL